MHRSHVVIQIYCWSLSKIQHVISPPSCDDEPPTPLRSTQPPMEQLDKSLTITLLLFLLATVGLTYLAIK